VLTLTSSEIFSMPAVAACRQCLNAPRTGLFTIRLLWQASSEVHQKREASPVSGEAPPAEARQESRQRSLVSEFRKIDAVLSFRFPLPRQGKPTEPRINGK
jgi:hypothetical protein